jgi:hypothetical protein
MIERERAQRAEQEDNHYLERIEIPPVHGEDGVAGVAEPAAQQEQGPNREIAAVNQPASDTGLRVDIAGAQSRPEQDITDVVIESPTQMAIASVTRSRESEQEMEFRHKWRPSDRRQNTEQRIGA